MHCRTVQRKHSNFLCKIRIRFTQLQLAKRDFDSRFLICSVCCFLPSTRTKPLLMKRLHQIKEFLLPNRVNPISPRYMPVPARSSPILTEERSRNYICTIKCVNHNRTFWRSVFPSRITFLPLFQGSAVHANPQNGIHFRVSRPLNTGQTWINCAGTWMCGHCVRKLKDRRDGGPKSLSTFVVIPV